MICQNWVFLSLFKSEKYGLNSVRHKTCSSFPKNDKTNIRIFLWQLCHCIGCVPSTLYHQIDLRMTSQILTYDI